MSDKQLSEKLRALRDEFNDLSERAKTAAQHLTSAMYEAQSNEYRAELNKVLDQFVPTVDKSSLKGHDIVFLINKSADMGEGRESPIGAALAVASSLSGAVIGHDTKVSAILWENGTKGVSLTDYDRLEKAREKSKTTEKQLLPAVREIMVANTPDKQDDRQKHYIIVSTGAVTDNLDHSVQMINTAMQMNPRLTFDFVTIGTGEGNVKDLVEKLNTTIDAQKPTLTTVQNISDVNTVVMSVLTGRFKNEAPKPVELPKAEPAKAEIPAAAVVETPKAVEAPAAVEPPKNDTPPAPADVPAPAAAPAAKKHWWRFGR